VRALALIAVFAPAIAQAQPANRPTAAQVLANVELTYKRPQHLTARFDQTVTYAAIGQTKKTAGRLYASKPAKMRWDYVKAKAPKGLDRSFIFDGTTLWVIDTTNLQVLQHTQASNNLPAAIAFFTGAGSLTTQFYVAFPTAPTHLVPGATVLQLTPKQPSAQYSQLYLVIDPSSWRVAKTIMIDSSGNTNMFEFSAVDMKTTIKPTVFQFSPSSLPNYRVITAPTAPATTNPTPSPPVRTNRTLPGRSGPTTTP